MSDPILETCEQALRHIIADHTISVYARLEAIRQLRTLSWEKKVGEMEWDEEQDETELDDWLEGFKIEGNNGTIGDFEIKDNLGPYEIL